MSAAELPPLRDELRLLPAAANSDGSPAWLVQDPVNNRFFRIGWLDFELLLRWAMGSPQQLVDAVNSETTLTVAPTDVNELKQFLARNNLLQIHTPDAVAQLQQHVSMRKKSLYEWLLNHYLFFRIPLLRPQAGLKRLAPYLDWLFTRQALLSLLVITFAGLFLIARQWDSFVTTLVDQFSWSGLLAFTVALVFAKALHEFGHALTATHYGVRVAHMGVAMVVMFPMLYTDTSESWKLSNPRQRLAIASAGIIAELALASIATLAWSLAPEGALKSALFFLATTSWLLTLAINASPFMRFDGYFILTDLLDLPNLHERSGALARAWLRRTLLGVNDPWPERLPGRTNGYLIAFAIFTWLYRLVVFLGIALLVYHFFFKLLGIALMIVELGVFVVRPIWFELKYWHTRRADVPTRRKRLAWVLGGALLLMMLLPWQTDVSGVGWVHSAQQQAIYSPLAGRVLTLPGKQPVAQGKTLFVLESPDLHIAATRAAEQAQARARELVGLAGLPEGESRRANLQFQQQQYQAEATMYQQEQSRLQLSAQFAGVLYDLDPLLAPGVWVQPRQPLAMLIDPAHWVADIYIDESDINRVRVGDAARVQMGNAAPYFMHGRVIEVDASRTVNLPTSMLDAKAGGPITTLPGTASESTPAAVLYRVKIQLDGVPEAPQAVICKAVISGRPRAFMAAVFERSTAVLIRESGF